MPCPVLICAPSPQITKTIDGLENPQQRDFIRQCLQSSSQRPGVRQLLLHPVLFEVHSLKLLATHALLNGTNDREHTLLFSLLQALGNTRCLMAPMIVSTPSCLACYRHLVTRAEI